MEIWKHIPNQAKHQEVFRKRKTRASVGKDLSLDQTIKQYPLA